MNRPYTASRQERLPKLSELKMQEGETVGAQWVTLDKFDEMIKSGTIALPVAERLAPLRKVFMDFLFSQCAIDFIEECQK